LSFGGHVRRAPAAASQPQFSRSELGGAATGHLEGPVMLHYQPTTASTHHPPLPNRFEHSDLAQGYSESRAVYDAFKSSFTEISPFFGQPPPSDAPMTGEPSRSPSNPQQTLWDDFAALQAQDIDWSAMQDINDFGPALTGDAIAVWGETPSSFELADWDMYLTNGNMLGDNPPDAPT